MKVLRGRARTAASTSAGRAVVAAVTTVLAIVAGPAQAVERGTCTDTVNVRERPTSTHRSPGPSEEQKSLADLPPGLLR